MNKLKPVTIVLLSLLPFVGGYWFMGKQNFQQERGAVKTVCDSIVAESKNEVTDIFDGESMPVDFSTNEKARMYKTTIEKQVADGPNFAGHYTVAAWGCGTECQGFAIVDLTTGEIVEYIPHFPFRASSGITSFVDSDVLVFNQKHVEPELKPAEDIVQGDFEVGKGRFYYQLREFNGKAGLYSLCVENIYSGGVK